VSDEQANDVTADVLVQQGRLAEAAALLEHEGQYEKAAALYARLWDFSSAARTARAAGNLTLALTHYLRARDEAAANTLAGQIARLEDKSKIVAAARGAEERGAWLIAAGLHERLTQLDRAADLFLKAGNVAEAARVNESAQRHQRAIELYQQHLASDPKDHERRFALGRLLLRFGRDAEGAVHLQAVWRNDARHAPRAGVGLVAALGRLGYNQAARTVLLALRAETKLAPETAQECESDPDFAHANSVGDERQVLAGRYRLDRLIGTGGMGRVYRATDLLTLDVVAIKVFAAPGGPGGRDAYARFVREARTAGSLTHPNLVPLIAFHEEQGFMVLQYMEGTLAERIGGGLPLGVCRRLMLQVIDGLVQAHQRGIVHRDIKPSNIFLDQLGAARLGDFGVAHLQDSGQTQTGSFIGTLAFMSPEQITGSSVGFATDIYGLGATLFLMLTGTLAYDHPGLVEKHLGAPIPCPSSRRSDLPAACDELVERCLAKQPADRYGSMAELRSVIASLPTDQAVAAIPATVARSTTAGSNAHQPAKSRYQLATDPYLITDHLCASSAHDRELGRDVIWLEIVDSPLRAQYRALLLAAASAGPSLQRVYAIEEKPDRLVAVLQQSTAAVVVPEQLIGQSEEQGLQLCCQLAEALLPLHQRRLVHGGIVWSAVSFRSDHYLLSLVESLVHLPQSIARGATPTEDIQAASTLAAVRPPPQIVSAHDLRQWAMHHLCEKEKKESSARIAASLQRLRALADAEFSGKHRAR
jgi:tetratricopeptide (TPR) repeat protein